MKKSKVIRILAAVLLLLAAFFAFERWYSSEHLVVTHADWKTPKVDEAIRVVLLADPHDHVFGKENERLIKLVSQGKPDLILLAGDILNGYSETPDRAVQLIRQLEPIAPLYVSMGNHEIDYEARTSEDLEALFEAAGADVLEMEYEDIEINGQKIRLGGMYAYAFAADDYNSTKRENMDPDTWRFLVDYQDTDRLKLMMAHRPDSFVFGEAAATWQVDLVFSGHLHGGQVVVPFKGGLWGGDQGLFPEYVHGLYEKENIHVLITSGLGSGKEPIPRLNNPPEIMTLTILPDEGEAK